MKKKDHKPDMPPKRANTAQRLIPEPTENSQIGNSLRAEALACASMGSKLVSATLNERKTEHEMS